MTFAPNLDKLPPSQLALWPELAATPESFTLYGGTALALRLGHRPSIDFDFFSTVSFDPERLADEIPYLRGAERIRIAPDTLTCRASRGGPVLLSFFGGPDLGQSAAASLLDLAGTKAAVIQKRAEVKDYLDIHAILQHGVGLPTILAAGSVIYGNRFNPLVTLKALSFFDDIPALPKDVRVQLLHAVKTIDVTLLPILTPYRRRSDDNGIKL